jgi:uncharacterized membrane protein HdeD (DUF308 family)
MDLMHFHVRDNWRLFVGLGLSVFAVFIALLGIGLGMTLTFLAFAVLILLTGVIELSLSSKLRHNWL